MNAFSEETKNHDAVESFGIGSLIQHGKQNDRVYLMKLHPADAGDILDKIHALAEAYQYSKLFCKVPKNLAPLFFANGFQLEAFIPQFYQGQQDVLFVSKFLKPERKEHADTEALKDLSSLLASQASPIDSYALPNDSYRIRQLGKQDIRQITKIFSAVFKTYPFPIHDSNYIARTMKEDVQYFGAEIEGELAAVASCEIDVKGQNAEMTDFATLDAHKGKRLSIGLLGAMEKAMHAQGISTLYTIARLNSIPMNKTFMRFGYEYSGTLVNNTNISGQIESMNIYYKHL